MNFSCTFLRFGHPVCAGACCPGAEFHEDKKDTFSAPLINFSGDTRPCHPGRIEAVRGALSLLVFRRNFPARRFGPNGFDPNFPKTDGGPFGTDGPGSGMLTAEQDHRRSPLRESIENVNDERTAQNTSRSWRNSRVLLRTDGVPG